MFRNVLPKKNDAARATSLAELPRFWHDVRGRVGSFLQTKVSTLGVLVFVYKHRLLPWACWQFCINIHLYLGCAGNFAQASVFVILRIFRGDFSCNMPKKP